MLKLLKNFFFSERFSKPTIISIVLVSIVLGLVLPLYPVHAGWHWYDTFFGGFAAMRELYGWLTGRDLAFDVFNGIILAIFTVLTGISDVFTGVCQSLLNWVISPEFINVSFTHNTFVDDGWRITRDLTNILIVLGLVVIALATILRISTYHAKKTLPLLLIVALLVNFSPVICGVIIDGSNIVMRYFLKVGGLDTPFLGRAGHEIIELARALKIGENPGVMLAKGVVFVGFNIFAGLIFLLYAFLFLFRYVALWMLVILSPLAFFCYVFPYTKKWWNMWWNQFLAWCIIGIPAAFSIFLANQMIGLIEAEQLLGETPGGGLSPFAGIIGHIVPLAFLVVGFYMAMQTGAAGADIAIKGFKWTKGRMWGAAKFAGKGTAAGIAGATAETRERKGKGAKKILRGIGKGLFTYEGHEKGRKVTARMLEAAPRMLEAAHLVRPGFYKETRRKRWKLDEEIKRMEKVPTDELHKIMMRRALRPSDVAAKAATFAALSKRRALKEEERKFFPTAKTYGVDTGETLKAMSHWAPDIGKKIKEQVEGRSPRQFRQETQPSALRNVAVSISMDVSKLRDIGTRGTEEQRRAIEETYKANIGRITRVFDEYVNRGRIREAERISDLVSELETNPNFSI